MSFLRRGNGGSYGVQKPPVFDEAESAFIKSHAGPDRKDFQVIKAEAEAAGFVGEAFSKIWSHPVEGIRAAREVYNREHGKPEGLSGQTGGPKER